MSLEMLTKVIEGIDIPETPFHTQKIKKSKSGNQETLEASPLQLMRPTESYIPIIDVSPLRSSNSSQLKQEVANQIAQASKKYGFLYIVGHGLPSSYENNLFDVANEFFSLPLEEKRRIPIQGGGFTRGYIEIGGESGSQRLEIKEGFSYGYDWDPNEKPKNSLQGANKWPSVESLGLEWRKKINHHYNEMVRISELMAVGLSLSLGKDENYLPSFCKGGAEISLMRLFHYMAPSKAGINTDKEIIGSSPHTDWGFLTLVTQDKVGGLQYFNHDEKRWIDLPPVEGAIIVNVGDYMSLMTGGDYISPLHRVVLPSDSLSSPRSRYSSVFFYYPSYNAVCPTIHGKLSDTQQERLYSLLIDQSKTSSDSPTPLAELQEKLSAVMKVPFGEYITEKWAQVFRS